MDKKTNKLDPFREVWNTLSQIDCSDFTQKKMDLTYLSWAWAWGILMEHFPEAMFEVVYFTLPTQPAEVVTENGLTVTKLPEHRYPYEVHPDGTATVWVKVHIHGVWRRMWLPVMDHRNQPIKNPNSRQISDATMRCLVKCLALFGLGHYIYAGEDLPPGEGDATPTADPAAIPVKSTLAHVIKGWEDTAVLYMIKLKWIKNGQSWKDITDNRAKQVVDKKDSFKQKAEEHAASSN